MMKERRWWRARCSTRIKGRVAGQVLVVSLLFLLPTLHALSNQPRPPTVSPRPTTKQSPREPPIEPRSLNGDWYISRTSLRRKDRCVTFVTGLEPYVTVLQEVLADQGPADIDLRARIRTSSSSLVYEDCLKIRNSVVPLSKGEHEATELQGEEDDPCTLALVELARGMGSLLGDETLENGDIDDVFCRIVCASDYRARDPPYHTDKAPLRGYVTLRGVGTEFMTRTCNPAEYLMLRTFGEGEPTKSLRSAEELEFIVMKGDYYDDVVVPHIGGSSRWNRIFWNRETACVHRSPSGKGGRRVIVSFDIADGDDDREWYQVGMKRQWRNGLTQRKSRLVA